MKQFENILETHKVYPEMFDICVITLQTRTRYLNSSVTRRLWLWPVKFAIEGTVASEVGIPGLSHIPLSRSHME
jgi:hypothetical protein